MTNSPSPRSTRTRLGAASLVVGALLFSVGDLLRRTVEPSEWTPPALAHAVAAHQATWSAVGVLWVLAGIVLAVGAATLFGTFTGRGARLTDLGAAMLFVGAIASVGHAVAYVGSFAAYAQAGVPDNLVTAADAAGSPMITLLVALFIVGMMLGTVVLTVGLWRARRVPVWLIVTAVVFVVAGSSAGVAAGVIGLVAALVTSGMEARAVVRELQPELEPEAVRA